MLQITILKKLDYIQNEALRLATGALTGTRNDILEIECGIPPLHLHRLERQLILANKINSIPEHPARNVLTENWTNYYGKFTRNTSPLLNIVKQFVEDNPLHIIINDIGLLGNKEPWNYKEIEIDLSLSYYLNK
ncbi:MAG: hypothetical protein ACM31H_06000 [Nitrososphaerales archaeon]